MADYEQKLLRLRELEQRLENSFRPTAPDFPQELVDEHEQWESDTLLEIAMLRCELSDMNVPKPVFYVDIMGVTIIS